jgi:integrase
MPRISKGPRLYKRKTKRKNGRLIANAVWTIRDGEREVATGIFAGEAERKPPKAAEDALARYITSKYQPPRRTRDIEDIDIADVLAIYHAHREGAYTGTRAGSIASASPYREDGRSYVDLEHGIFYRLAQGQAATKKRQPPAPLPDRLLAHMRRWVRTEAITSHFVEFNGAAVKSVKTGFRSAVRIAGLSSQSGKVTPHTLRHTAATWLMQRGADPWKAAGFLGMSVEVLLDTYGHHHPEFLRDAAAAITSKPKQNIVSGVISGVDLAAYREKRRKAL